MAVWPCVPSPVPPSMSVAPRPAQPWPTRIVGALAPAPGPCREEVGDDLRAVEGGHVLVARLGGGAATPSAAMALSAQVSSRRRPLPIRDIVVGACGRAPGGANLGPRIASCTFMWTRFARSTNPHRSPAHSGRSWTRRCSSPALAMLRRTGWPRGSIATARPVARRAAPAWAGRPSRGAAASGSWQQAVSTRVRGRRLRRSPSTAACWP